MNVASPRAAAVMFAIGAVLTTTAARGQAPPASAAPSPSPSATPSGPSDPCGSILSIVTRPTVTTSTCTVRDGHALVETGYTNATVTGASGGVTASYPQAFLRVGIGQHVELAFTPPSYNRSSIGDTMATGSSDTNLNVKWEIGYSEKAVWGANVQVSAPTGSPAFTAGGAEYTANANWGYALNSVWSLAGTFGFNSLAGPNASGQFQRYSAFIPSMEVTAALPGTSQAFLEYAYFSHDGPGFGPKNIVDFGYQRDFGAHVQLDVEYGFQPNVVNGQKQHYVGAGLSLMN